MFNPSPVSGPGTSKKRPGKVAVGYGLCRGWSATSVRVRVPGDPRVRMTGTSSPFICRGCPRVSRNF